MASASTPTIKRLVDSKTKLILVNSPTTDGRAIGDAEMEASRLHRQRGIQLSGRGYHPIYHGRQTNRRRACDATVIADLSKHFDCRRRGMMIEHPKRRSILDRASLLLHLHTTGRNSSEIAIRKRDVVLGRRKKQPPAISSSSSASC